MGSAAKKHNIQLGGLKVNKWISVKDRLPDEEIEVLAIVLCENETLMYDLNECYEGKWLLSGSQAIVTHWMILPALPEAS